MEGISHDQVRVKDAGVLVLEPKSALSAEDFREISSTIDPYIREKGKLVGLLIEAPSFPGWDSFGALIDHFKFVYDHHRNIDRIAAFTDSAFLKIAPTRRSNGCKPAHSTVTRSSARTTNGHAVETA